jgi:hypothetical protein
MRVQLPHVVWMFVLLSLLPEAVAQVSGVVHLLNCASRGAVREVGPQIPLGLLDDACGPVITALWPALPLEADLVVPLVVKRTLLLGRLVVVLLMGVGHDLGFVLVVGAGDLLGEA